MDTRTTFICKVNNPHTGVVEFPEHPHRVYDWVGYALDQDGRSRVVGYSNARDEAEAATMIARNVLSGTEVTVVPARPANAAERDAYLARRALLAPTDTERAKWARVLTMAAVDRLRASDDEQRIAKEHVADMVDQAMHFLGAAGTDWDRYESTVRRLTTAADIAARWFLIVDSNLGGRRSDAEGVEAKLVSYLAKRDALIARLEVVTLAGLAPV